MEEKDITSDQTNRQRIRQSISIPFIWEEKPGIPKKDWTPSVRLINPVNPPPIVKLLASPPSTIEPPEVKIGGGDGDESESESDESSYSSAPSLLANRLVPTSAISGAVPVTETSPPSPAEYESDGSTTSSYATGTTSLVGAPLLERIFPLLAPNWSFLENVSPRVNCGRNGGLAMKMTLGELIMMSRRRSCLRKAADRTPNPKQSISMELMKMGASGCCALGNSRLVRGFQMKWRRQWQLKLV